MDFKKVGAATSVIGFVALMIGAFMALGELKAGDVETDFFVLSGLALLVVGCGLFGFGWTSNKWPEVKLSVNAKWGLIATFVSVVVVAVIALWADAAKNVVWLVISVGALGGLVHEIVQSKGTAFLPGNSGNAQASPQASKQGNPQGNPQDNKQASPQDNKQGNPPDNNDDNGEGYLGGLVGVVLGGAAGLLTLSTSSTSSGPVTVTMPLIIASLSAGIALKGIADAAASPAKGASDTTSSPPQSA